MKKKEFKVLLMDFNRNNYEAYDVLPYFRNVWKRHRFNRDKDYNKIPVKTREQLKADIGVEGELFQSIKRIPTLQDVYEFFMAKAEAFGMPTLALYARYCYRFKEAMYNLEYSSESL